MLQNISNASKITQFSVVTQGEFSPYIKCGGANNFDKSVCRTKRFFKECF